MANPHVKRLTVEERAELRKLHPDADIREFQVVNEHGVALDYFDSVQEARSFLGDLKNLALVKDAFRDWAQKTAEEFGMSREEVLSIAKDCC